MIIGCSNQQNSVIKIMQTMLSTMPAFSMSFILIWPLAKTMALGGVPMGNILAQLAPSVMGMPNKSGSMCSATATDEITGAITITCATLLMTSLKKMEKVVTMRIIKKVLSVA